MAPISGLHYMHNYVPQYLPWVKIKSHTIINPLCFTTVLSQTFRNPDNTAIKQARYTFPLYDGVAVNGYVISYGEQKLVGVVDQQAQAKATYQAAIDRGETASFLENLPAGVFGVTIGNVPANCKVYVDITYCGELKHDAAIDGLRYTLPTSIAPRDGDYPGALRGAEAFAQDGIAILVDIDMMGSSIRKVQSPSHPIGVSMGSLSTATASNAPFVPSQASASLSLGKSALAQDFVLQLLVDDISKPQAILEEHPTIHNQRAVMATLIPRFTLPPSYPEIVFIADQSGSMAGSKNIALVAALRVFLKSLPFGVRFNICAFGTEYNFLWPKSKAYSEVNVIDALAFLDEFRAQHGGTNILEPITAAFKQRLLDMPLEVLLLTDGETWHEDSIFQFINEQVHTKRVDARVFALGIGGDVSHTLVEGVARAGNGFAQFVTDNEEPDQKVIRMLKGALYAHTKDYKVEVRYEADDTGSKTDGGDIVVNEDGSDDGFDMVERVNECLRISDEDLRPTPQERPVSFFGDSMDVDEPSMKEGESAIDRYAHLVPISPPKLLQAPSEIPPLFPFSRSTFYLLLGPDSIQRKVASITLRASAGDTPLELNVPVKYTGMTTSVATVHQLAVRRTIQDLEEGRGWLQHATVATSDDKTEPVNKKHESRFDEFVERECVRLGKLFQVAGKWTSFVAVNSNDDEQDEEWEHGNADHIAATMPGGTKKAVTRGKRTGKKQKLKSESSSHPFGATPAHFNPTSPSYTMASGYSPMPQRMANQSHMDMNGGLAFEARIPHPSPLARPGMFFQRFVDSPAVQFAYHPLGGQAPSHSSARTMFNSIGNAAPPSLKSSRGPPASPIGARQALFGAPAAPLTEHAHHPSPTPAPPRMAKSQEGFGGCDNTGHAFSLEDEDEDSVEQGFALFDGQDNCGVTADSEPPSIKSTSPTDRMRALIGNQTFSGSWEVSPGLFSLLDVDVDDLARSPLASHARGPVGATILVVAFFERKMSENRDVWELVAEKARAWLSGRLSSDEIARLVGVAGDLLR